jgi:hypothetical protein
LPLSFEANHGQTDDEVKFLTRDSGYTLFLTSTEAVIQLRGADCGLRNEAAKSATRNRKSEIIRMKLVGAKPSAKMTGQEELPGKVNYFLGNDPTKWLTNVPTYAKIKYEDVYPSVDLVYYGHHGRLEYDFVVAPGADPETIKLEFEGAERAEINAQGALVLHTTGGSIRQHKPLVYQDVGGRRIAVEGSFHLITQSSGNRNPTWTLGFNVAAYDQHRPLVIDPVLVYSTYLGGTGRDVGSGVAVDALGNIYATGETFSSDFPTANAMQPSFRGVVTDAFVAKLNPTGTALVYSTFFGGSPGGDAGVSISVDAAGNAYVTGVTASRNFPTVTPLQPAFSGGPGDAFVVKLNPTGSALIYSTFLGGGEDDVGLGITVDAAGNAYVTGYTQSKNFPTATPLRASFGGGTEDAFVAKVNPTGTALVYSTFLGGGGNDRGNSIAVDTIGNVSLTGVTHSLSFPTANPLQPVRGSPIDAFVLKLSQAGNELIYSTYFGGSGNDEGFGIAVDGSGNAFVVGSTASMIFFPTTNALQPTHKGGGDAFIAKFNPTGSALIYSTYLGGSSSDEAHGVAVDASGNAYVIGLTNSTDFPTANSLQSFLDGSTDTFVVKLNATGSALIYSTYLGGSGLDFGIGIAVDALGNAYVAGSSTSTNFATARPLQAANSGGSDAFIAKIADAPVPPIPPDLVVRDLTVSSTTPAPGDTISVSFSIMNQGMATAGAATHYVVLSKDAIIDASDRFLADRGTPSLPADNSLLLRVTVIIPADTMVGTQFIGVIADVEDAVMESNEMNNTEAVMINVRSSMIKGLASSNRHRERVRVR